MSIDFILFVLAVAELFCLIYIFKSKAYIKHPRLYIAVGVFSVALVVATAINMYIN